MDSAWWETVIPVVSTPTMKSIPPNHMSVTWERARHRSVTLERDTGAWHRSVTWERDIVSRSKLNVILWLTYLAISSRADSFENGLSVLRNGDSCSFNPHRRVHTTQPHERDMKAWHQRDGRPAVHIFNGYIVIGNLWLQWTYIYIYICVRLCV